MSFLPLLMIHITESGQIKMRDSNFSRPHEQKLHFCMFTQTHCFLGESGLGKSTLINSLFLTDLYKDRKLLNAEGMFLLPYLTYCSLNDAI